MQVVHINMAQDLRGGEWQTLALVEALSGNESGSHLSHALLVRQGSRFHRHCINLHNIELRAAAPSMRCVFAAANDADLVHVHEGRSPKIGALLSLKGTPMVITRRVPNRPKDFFLTRWTYSRAKHVACVSNQVADVMRDYMPHALVSTVYDGVRSAAVSTVPDTPKRRDYLVAATIGEIDFAHKGQDVLVAAAAILAAKNVAVRFIVAGSGRDEIRLRQLSAEIPNFEMRGWVDDVPSLFDEADILIHPARREGLGSVLLEAMANGVPIIASAVGGIPEIVEPGVNGLLVSPESPDEIANAVASLAEDPPALKKLSEGSRRLANQYTATVMADKYLSIYASILS